MRSPSSNAMIIKVINNNNNNNNNNILCYDVSGFQSCKLRNACDSLLNIKTPARFRGVSSFIHLGMFNNVLKRRILDEASLRGLYRSMLTERLS